MIKSITNFLKYNRWFAEQKFRLDLGISFMVVINLCLLAITASDKINQYTGISQWILILIGPPFALTSTWAFGYFLDKMRFQHNINENINQRNPQIQDILKKLDAILTRLDKGEKHDGRIPEGVSGT